MAALGEREGDTKHLEDAVAAFGEALNERTREWVPLQWAQTQNNLGGALESLGECQKDPAKLAVAISAFKAAPSVFDQPDFNYDTSALKRNLSESETALKALQARQEVKAIAP